VQEKLPSFGGLGFQPLAKLQCELDLWLKLLPARQFSEPCGMKHGHGEHPFRFAEILTCIGTKDEGQIDMFKVHHSGTVWNGAFLSAKLFTSAWSLKHACGRAAFRNYDLIFISLGAVT
jgi:hypothetical protein